MGEPIWDGYPPDRTKDGWHWLGQKDDLYNRHPTHWSAERQIWTQGGLCCGGSAFPSQMTQGYAPPVRWFGHLPELAVSNAMLAALEAALPSLDSLVSQDCPDPDVNSHDIMIRAQARAAIKLAKEG